MFHRICEKTSELRPFWRVVWLVILAGVFLAPAIQTGYWAEDLYQSIMSRGASVVRHQTLPEVIKDHVRHTMVAGRFFPLTPVLISTVHYVFEEAWAYKTYIVALGIFDVFLFYCLVARLSGRRDFACFAACLTIGVIQYKVAVDPSLGFFGQMQLVIASLFLSLLTLQRFLDGRRWVWLIVSVGLYFACTLTYESTYVLAFLHACLIARASTDWGQRIRLASPFFAASGFCVFQSFFVRWLFPSDAYWHNTNFDPQAVSLAIAYQTTAGFPLSYFLVDPIGIFPGVGQGEFFRWLFNGRVALVVVPAFGLSFLCLRNWKTASEQTSVGIGWRWLTVIGLILAIFPTLMISISPYHRANIALGVGWSPVVIQYYGVGLLVSAAVWNAVTATFAGGPRAGWKCVAASMLVASIVGLTYRANREVVRCYNALPGTKMYRENVGKAGGAWHNQRLLLEAALGAGLLDQVPEHSTVVCAHEYPYWYDSTFSRFFYAAYSGKSLETVMPSAAADASRSEAYQVRDVFVGRDAGYVVLSRDVREPATSTGLRLFVRHPDLFNRARRPLDWQITSKATAQSGDPLAIPGWRLTSLRTGPDWAIYSLDRLEKPIALESLQVVFEPSRNSVDPATVAEKPISSSHR